MIVRRLAALALAAAASCMAQECPWMNAATASDLLGGNVRVAVTNNTCNFSMRQSDSFKNIRIQVEALPASDLKPFGRHCSSRRPVSGLGNEAFACRVKTKKRMVAVRLAGRVRNQAFLVDVSTNEHDRADQLLEIAKKAAGQVAGNLF